MKRFHIGFSPHSKWLNRTVDTKDLKDIPHYWPQMKSLALPKYQFTAREVRGGLMFLGFGNEKSAASACLFARLLCEHLGDCGIDLKLVKFQTDNGSEFIGCFRQDRSRDGWSCRHRLQREPG